VSRAATQAEADALAAALCRQFRAILLRKRDRIEMQIAGALFDLARLAGVDVPSSEDFARYATTLGPFIYLPDGLTPDQEIETVTHECQHVHQFWDGGEQTGIKGGTAFAWLYLTQPEARVRLEAEAYRAGMEVSVARGAPLPSLRDLALPLEQGYALGPGEILLGRQLLEVAATSAASGLVGTEAARAAIAWMRAHAPDLLAGTSGR
jgi:hypothetical protein